MEGFYSPYVPGWDCHGLPIEHKVDQKLGSRKKEHEPAPGPRGVPAVRRKIPRPAARRLQAPGRLRRLGAPLHHPRPRLRGHGHPLLQLLRQEGQRLPQEAPGLLVPLLPHGPGRGRGRIPRPRVALDHGEVPAARAAAVPEGIRRPPRLGPDLDHHPLDHPGQPGHRRPRRLRLRPVRNEGRAAISPPPPCCRPSPPSTATPSPS